TLAFFATHLDHRRGDRERLAGVAKINARARAISDRPAILAGDMNAVPESAVLKQLQKEWSHLYSQTAPTVPVDQPRRQIDFVLVRPAAVWQLVEARVLDERVASDHRPVLAVFKLRNSVAHIPKAVVPACGPRIVESASGL
ncbi:MAG: endonuclease/exonuclease/phosphatase family protein, partial [Planctomycetaceae bacterium]